MVCAATPDPSKVVVVDDDEAVCAALAFALELEGFDVQIFDSGEALLRCILPAFGACLVVDERLPGISGLDALMQLRIQQVTLPALLMTSNPSISLRAAAAAVGVPIIEKPLLGDLLSDAIRAALRT